MKRISLKLRLTLSFLGVAIIVWLISAALSWFETREQMDEFFDTYQVRLARQLATADWKNIKPDTQKKTDQIIDAFDDDGEDEEEALGFAVFDANGEMVFNDGKMGRYYKYEPDRLGFSTQKIGKHEWRIVWMKMPYDNFTAAIGQEIDFRNEAALELVEQSLAPWAVGLLILMLASTFMTGRSLKSMNAVAKNLSRRSSNNLDPINLDDMPEEIEPLLVAMNRLFGQIDGMIKRERSFISDAAHELRSPLTALKVQLDVAILAGDDKETKDNALNKLAEGIKRSSRLVEQLLALSRLESSQHANAIVDINWEKLVEEALADLQPLIKKKNLSVSFAYDGEPPFTNGQLLLCSLLVRNLLDNAVKYSPENGSISIKSKNYKFFVINSGIKVDEEYLANGLGKRFFRPPGQKESGSGLGLAIVERIADIHDCKVNYKNTDSGFCVEIVQID